MEPIHSMHNRLDVRKWISLNILNWYPARRDFSFLGLCLFFFFNGTLIWYTYSFLSVGISSYLLAQDRLNSIILYLMQQMMSVDCLFTHSNSVFWQEDCCVLYSNVTVIGVTTLCYWPFSVIAMQSGKFNPFCQLFTVSHVFILWCMIIAYLPFHV